MAEEKNLENKVKKFLKEQGCWYIKYWGGGGYTKSGIPDLLVCCNGVFLAVELKATSGRVSDLQKFQIREIKKAGGVALVLYPQDYEEFKLLVIDLNSSPIQRILRVLTDTFTSLFRKGE